MHSTLGLRKFRLFQNVSFSFSRKNDEQGNSNKRDILSFLIRQDHIRKFSVQLTRAGSSVDDSHFELFFRTTVELVTLVYIKQLKAK